MVEITQTSSMENRSGKSPKFKENKRVEWFVVLHIICCSFYFKIVKGWKWFWSTESNFTIIIIRRFVLWEVLKIESIGFFLISN